VLLVVCFFVYYGAIALVFISLRLFGCLIMLASSLAFDFVGLLVTLWCLVWLFVCFLRYFFGCRYGCFVIIIVLCGAFYFEL